LASFSQILNYFRAKMPSWAALAGAWNCRRLPNSTNAPAEIADERVALPHGPRAIANRLSTFEFPLAGQAPPIFNPYYAVRDGLTTTYFK
jgi:hypothetical protein